jgi:hypothetical protein
VTVLAVGASAAPLPEVPALAQEPAPLLRGVNVFGTTLFREELAVLVDGIRGRPYDPQRFRAFLETVVRIYHGAGYVFARVTSLDPHLYDDGYYMTVRVSEGRIGEIQVRGVHKTRADVIRRQLLLEEGQIYREHDVRESERILRTRPYLGTVRLHATADPDTNLVRVDVWAEDLWSIVPRVRLVETDGSFKGLFSGDIAFQASVSDSNLFGSGEFWRLSYRWDIPDDTRAVRRTGQHRLGVFTQQPNLFRSRWQLEAGYEQPSLVDHDAWELHLSHPFYSLQTDWAFDARAFETAFVRQFRYDGRLLREWEHHVNGQFLGATRAFGEPNNQLHAALWAVHQDTDFTLRYTALPIATGSASWASLKDEERRRLSPRSRPTEKEMLFGTNLTWQRIRYAQTQDLDRLGRVEDIPLGHFLTLSGALGLEAMDNSHDEVRPALHWRFARRWADAVFADGRTTLSAPYVMRNGLGGGVGWRDIVWQAQARLFLRHWSGQTVAGRAEVAVATKLADDLSLPLDDRAGVRGYPRYAFDGTRRLVFGLEARRILWRHPWAVVQGAVFGDQGYIWRDTFPISGAKRSVGTGLRIALLRLTDSPIVRVDLAYRMDAEPASWALSVGSGQYF